MKTEVISVSHLHKSVKDKVILEDISFKITKGECVALIGPNGAGKTTLMACLLGHRRLSQGNLKINDLAPRHPANRAALALLGQENVIPETLKVKELLDFFRASSTNPLPNSVIDEWLQFSPAQKEQLTNKLSGGQKRLLAFVLCMIGQPSLIFLDEPTAGMDTSTRKRFWQIIQQIKAKGTTIIYSSHYIEEVEHTADRILVLHEGKLLRDTTPYAMRSEEREKLVTLPKAYAPLVQELSAVEEVTLGQDMVSFKTRDIARVWQNLQEAGCSIADIEIQNKTLLDTIFEQTKGE